MRPIILLVLMTYSFLVNAQKADPVVVNTDSFPGRVKSVVMTVHVANPFKGDSVYEPKSSTSWTIGSDGKWNTRREEYSDGDQSFDTITYDPGLRTKRIRRSNGFEPSTTTIAYNPDGTVNSIFIDNDQREDVSDQYEYDKQARLIKHTQVFADGQTVEEYVYHKSGLLTEMRRLTGTTTSKKLTLDFKATYTYDASGNCVRALEQFFASDGNIRISDTITMTYGAGARLELKTEVRQNGEQTIQTEYAYDSLGRITGKNYTLYSRAEQRITYHCTYRWEYDEKGYYSLVHEECDDHTIVSTYKTRYNDKGFPIMSEVSTPSEKLLFTWEYEYR